MENKHDIITVWVTTYHLQLACAGSAEGGDYYVAGEPLDNDRITARRDVAWKQAKKIKAARYADAAKEWHAMTRAERRDWLRSDPHLGADNSLSDVNSPGRLQIILSDTPPQPFPLTVPHYE